ncbi:PREDICTED: IgGFc-binding protein-like [Branchiostoma belcheri]|uniref:IgGFc-binding protein-like n=1 Tax=Branchiostoma belcheri TaxID=7741 RepID=A0A6P4YN85_BRABE|nr:PREDICTED: IgGFc-binding protein-like [Branchiostoma belcheri]
MKAISVVVFLMLVVAGQGARDNKGTEFILTFTENMQRDLNEPRLLVAGTTQTPATVTVEVPSAGFQQTFDIKFGEVNTINLPRTGVELRGSDKQNTGILVTATDEIVVYGVFAERASSDAYLAIPTDVLGTEYFVSCYVPINNHPSQFGIVGVSDGTTVNIVPTKDVTFGGTAYTAGQTITVTLDRLQTLQVQSDAADLTGSKITSDKNVAVLSGNLFAVVGNGHTGSGDHIVEMIPPVDTWGKEFVTVPLAKRTAGDLFRVIAARDNTQVDITGKNTHTLNAGEYWKFSGDSDEYLHVVTTEPVLLMQYSKTAAADNTATDPFMLMIPPLQQFAADYTFATTQLLSDPSLLTHHVNIAIQDSEKAGLRLDGNPLDASVTWTAIPGTTMSGTRIDIPDGTHTLVHTSPIVTFGISVYGFTSPESYGYPGGLRLAQIAAPCVVSATVPGDVIDNDCDGRIDEELANGLDDDGDGAIDEDLAAQAPVPCESDKDDYKDCVQQELSNCVVTALLSSGNNRDNRVRRAAEETEDFAGEPETEEFVVAAIAVVVVGVVMVVVMAMTYHFQKKRLLAA